MSRTRDISSYMDDLILCLTSTVRLPGQSAYSDALRRLYVQATHVDPVLTCVEVLDCVRSVFGSDDVSYDVLPPDLQDSQQLDSLLSTLGEEHLNALPLVTVGKRCFLPERASKPTCHVIIQVILPDWQDRPTLVWLTCSTDNVSVGLPSNRVRAYDHDSGHLVERVRGIGDAIGLRYSSKSTPWPDVLRVEIAQLGLTAQVTPKQ